MTFRSAPLTAVLFGFAVTACGPSKPATSAGDLAPKSAAFKTYPAATLHKTVSHRGASFSHDGSRILVSSDKTGVFNVYAVPVDGGAPIALTNSTSESAYAVSFFPEDDRFLYASDQGGNELDHVFVGEAGKEARDLTPGDKTKARFLGWRDDDKAFFVSTNERDPKAFDIYRYAADDYARELVFENKGGFRTMKVSPNGRYIALGKVASNADGDVYLLDTEAPSAKPQLITEHKGDIVHDVEVFSPDSKQLYYKTNEHGEWLQIWAYPLADGAKPTVKVDAKWDARYLRFSRTGRYEVVAINADAKTVINVIDSKAMTRVEMPKLPEGDVAAVRFSRAEDKMAFYVQSDRSPPDLYVHDFASKKHRRLTTSLNPDVDPAHLVDGEVVRYKSFDGRDIPAILYKPHQAKSGKVPALVWVHGGPGGQSRLGYSATKQHLVNQGYALLAVNNRGSSGYGKTFFHLDDKNHGEGDLKDCVFGKKYLQGLDWVDGDRIGIIGGSYGGFMVLAALAFEPTEFAVGVDIFGVSNWLRTLESIPPWWEAFRKSLYSELGDPATDRERLRKISPLFHASNIVRPLLVIQGANDPRVLKVESDEIVAAVKKNNVPVEYVVFEDEGHGFAKRENRIKASEAMLKFVDQHLRGRK